MDRQIEEKPLFLGGSAGEKESKIGEKSKEPSLRKKIRGLP